jgi:hypothetical protein
MSTDQPGGELLGELPQKSKRGRPRKPITQARIAAQLGTSRRALYRAEAHVKACEQYPELQTSTLAVDKQIALAQRLHVGQSSPVLAQYLLVESIAREFQALQRKLARVEQRYTEERAKLSKLVEAEAEHGTTGWPR